MHRNKAVPVFCLLLIALAVFRAGVSVGASGNEPGSAGDPLVTQSYLEKRLKETAGQKGNTNSGTESNTSYKKVTVSSGKTITGSAGAEFVIYSGSGSIIGASGLINLTTGEKFSSGKTAVKYCVYLISEENCGIRMTSNSVVFVKGSYKIN